MALSDRPGMGNWQAELDNLLTCSRGNDCLKTFGAIRTDGDRSRFIFDQNLLTKVGWLRQYFTDLCQTFHQKDAQRAAHHKQEGNKLFLAQQDKQALQSYTQSMQFAPFGRELTDEKDLHLGVAYGNRSAVLFRLHKYQECLTDIERALTVGTPKQSKPKLLVRRCLCYAKLGQKDGAVAGYLETEMIKAKKLIESIHDSSADHHGQLETQALIEPAVLYGANSVLIQASSAVEMKTSPSQGRFLQATRDIQAGDTLMVERPFAAVLLPPHYTTHCLHCFVALPGNPVGCRQCSGVLYCSEECRDNSWATYHHVECRYMDLLHSVGIAHLSLRIVLTMGLPSLQDFLEQREEGCAPGSIAGVTEEGRYERNYLAVFDLMTHSQDMAVEDLFQYSLTANLLLAILIHTGWLSKPQPPQPDTSRDLEMDSLIAFLDGSLFQNSGSQGSELCAGQVFSVGSALLRHVQQLVCNAHAITALHSTEVSEKHLVETRSQVRVATAIYPTASLMNHSCDPTIISSFQKDLLVVKCTKDVTLGGEIFNCYGPHCRRMKRRERQDSLKSQYFFDCRCEACGDCQEDSPLTTQGVRCPDCGGTIVADEAVSTCPSCHVTVDMSSVLSQLGAADSHFTEGLRYMELGDYTSAVQRFRRCLKVRSKVMSANNHDLGQVHDAIAQCLASTGCYAEATAHLTDSVAITEAIFGASSIETARELHKMAEVLIHAGRPKDALASASRALDVASKLYNEKDDWVQELLCLKTALTKIIADGDVR
ncbi:hypothetical protein ACOMHN_007782 [Nucella lapillus]